MVFYSRFKRGNRNLLLLIAIIAIGVGFYMIVYVSLGTYFNKLIQNKN